jgi:hypothetical protein
LATHLEMVDDIERALISIRKGEIVEIFHSDFNR